MLVHHVAAGPFEGLTKDELPGQLCAFAREVLRAEAGHEPGYYDLVHSHYWLSGQVGALARDRWGVPLVHSMHTMAKVKNAALADGDTPEPAARVIGEEQVVEAADMLIANTDIEAKQLIDLYDADPARVEVVHPGVDLDVFRPRTSAGARAAARAARGRDRADVRRPDPAAEGPRRAAARGRGAARARPVAALAAGRPRRRRPVRHRARAPRVARRSSPRRSASPTSCGSCRRSPRTSSPTGTPRPRWSCVPSYNESFGLVADRGAGRRHAGRGRRRRRADDRRRATARPALLVDGHDPRRLRRGAAPAGRRPGAAATGSARGALEHAPRVRAGSGPPSARSTVYRAGRAR